MYASRGLDFFHLWFFGLNCSKMRLQTICYLIVIALFAEELIVHCNQFVDDFCGFGSYQIWIV